MLHWNEYIQIFTAIVVIVDPIGAIPFFISMTADQPEKQKKSVARVAALSTGVILIIAALLGKSVLDFFGISIDAFRIAGGILLLLIAVAMVHARQSAVKQSPEEAEEAESRENIAVVPLAIPLLAGPAAISTVIIYAHNITGWVDRGYIILCCLATAALVWLALRVAVPMAKHLGKTGINVASRVMGLLLAAIAVEFIIRGLENIISSGN